MIWLWAYLGVGILCLVVLLAIRRLRRGDSSTSELLAAIRGPVSRTDWWLEKVVGPGIASLSMVLFWPLGVYMFINEERARLPPWVLKEETVFQVSAADLVRQTDVAAVELAEMVSDPMGAVPRVPFGFLNKVWREFVDSALPDAVLWTFETVWTDVWEDAYYRQGYVWVHDGKPGHWMLTHDERAGA